MQTKKKKGGKHKQSPVSMSYPAKDAVKIIAVLKKSGFTQSLDAVFHSKHRCWNSYYFECTKMFIISLHKKLWVFPQSFHCSTPALQQQNECERSDTQNRSRYPLFCCDQALI